MHLLTRSEEFVLLAVWKLQDRAYGAEIQKHLSEITGRDWSFGAVYVPLERMVSHGLLSSFKGRATSKRGGRRKRFFRLTPAGLNALNAIREIQDGLWAGLPELRFEEGH